MWTRPPVRTPPAMTLSTPPARRWSIRPPPSCQSCPCRPHSCWSRSWCRRSVGRGVIHDSWWVQRKWLLKVSMFALQLLFEKEDCDSWRRYFLFKENWIRWRESHSLFKDDWGCWRRLVWMWYPFKDFSFWGQSKISTSRATRKWKASSMAI